MNLFSYIDKYGSISFDEEPFNEVDNIIFSALAYVSLGNYVSHNRFNKRTIKEVGDDFFVNYDVDVRNIAAVRNGVKVLRYIKDTCRYGNLLLYNYAYVGDKNQQFSAITIEINKGLVYISFEGTDQLISGWKEDFMIAYSFPILSQRKAINYVNKYFWFGNKKIILGGHSKGGHLAVVASMGANYFIKRRIIRIYNNDGPGLRMEQINSKSYKYISNKIKNIIPNYSFFGLMLNHTGSLIVIKSSKRSFWAHALNTWVVDDKKLKRAKLSDFSYRLNKGMKTWINQYDDKVREKVVKALFLVFDRANVESIVDIMDNKKLIFKLIMEYNSVDKEVRDIMRNLIYVVLKYFKDNRKGEVKSLFDDNNGR